MIVEKKNGKTVFKCGKKYEQKKQNPKPKKNKKEALDASKIIMEENNYGN